MDYQSPEKKRKKRSEEAIERLRIKKNSRKRGGKYRSTEAMDKRRKNDTRRSEEAMDKRRKNDKRRSEEAMDKRRKNDNRRSEKAIERRSDRDARRSEEGIVKRKNVENRRSEEATERRSDRDARRSEEGIVKRKNVENRRSEEATETRRDRDSRRLILSIEKRKATLIERIENVHIYENLIEEYERNIKEGPECICNSCGGLFFENDMWFYENDELIEIIGNDLLQSINQKINDGSVIGLCNTCRNDILKSNIPRLCLINGLNFPEIPDVLSTLTSLEERLVSARLPFMQIRERRAGKQFGLKGNVVNVPINVDKSIDVLPRTFDKSETIQILLKRMIKHKSSYLNEFVRPAVIFEAAKFLIQSPLYIEEGIALSNDWLATYNSESADFVVDNESDNEDIPSEDEWNETGDDNAMNPGKDETLLKEGIVFAPGEGETPISVINDQYVEELSFPKIFCGQKRNIIGKLSYKDIARSELRSCDRRCCNA